MGLYLVYILKCWNHPQERNTNYKLYTGFTNDLDRRLKEHGNPKKNKYTSRFKYMKYMYYEKVRNRIEAREREEFIKNQSRKWKLNLIKEGRNKRRW